MALPAPAGDVESAGAVLPVGPDGHVSREWEEAMEAWREDREAWSRRRETGYARDDAEPPPPPPLPPGTSRAASALASPYLPGACVPRGTHGRAIPRPGTSVEPVAEEQEEADDDDAAMTAAGGPGATAPTADIVAWNAPADGVRILVARLCVLSVAGCAPGGATAADAAELDASLDFVRRVLTSAPSFAAKLAACDAATSVPPGTPTTPPTLSPRSSPAPRPPARRGRRFRARAASGAPGAGARGVGARGGGAARRRRARERVGGARGDASASRGGGRRARWGTAPAAVGVDAGNRPGRWFGDVQRAVLPAEQAMGRYPLTLALLRLTEIVAASRRERVAGVDAAVTARAQRGDGTPRHVALPTTRGTVGTPRRDRAGCDRGVGAKTRTRERRAWRAAVARSSPATPPPPPPPRSRSARARRSRAPRHERGRIRARRRR